MNTKYKIQVIGTIWSGGVCPHEKTFDVPLLANQVLSNFGDFSSITDYQVIKVESEVKAPDKLTTQFIRTETIVLQWQKPESEEQYASMTFSE